MALRNSLKSRFQTANLILASYTLIFAALLFIFSLSYLGVTLPSSFDISPKELSLLYAVLSASIIVFHLFLPKEDTYTALKDTALLVGVISGFIAALMSVTSTDIWVRLLASLIAAPLILYLMTVKGILLHIGRIFLTAAVAAVIATVVRKLAPNWGNPYCFILLVGVTAGISHIASQYALCLMLKIKNKLWSSGSVKSEDSER